MPPAQDDATARTALMQRMIARSRDAVQRRNQEAALRREALRRVGLQGVRDDIETLVIPAQREPLVPVTAARRRWLRRHLVKMLRGQAAAQPAAVSPVPDPGVLATRGCALCQGVCCGHAGDRAYLTEATMARVAAAQPDLSPPRILRRYMDAVPEEAVRGSCIYHGARGCTLDRSLRADVCNSHYCPPMRGLSRSMAARGPRDVLLMAVENGVLHTAGVVTAEEQR